MSDDPTLGEVGRTVLRVEADVRGLRQELKDQAAIFVTRAEYDERSKAVDREIVAIRDEGRASRAETKAEIQSGFAEFKAQRAPWWVMLSSGVAVLTLFLVLIERTA